MSSYNAYTVYTVLLYNVRYYHAVIVHTVSLYAMYIVTIQCSYSVIKHTCDSAQCHYIRVQYTVYIILYIIIIQRDSAATQCQYISTCTLAVSVSLYIVHCHYTAIHISICMLYSILYSVATNLYTVYN